jgi:carboxylesterase type B
VYAYEFNDRNAPYYYPPMPGFTPLAAHTIDIQFLFPLWHGGILGVPGASQSPALTPQESILSDELVAAWTKFARTGNPNGTGNSPWPPFVNRKACLSTYRRTYRVCRRSPMRSSVPATTVTSGTSSSFTSHSENGDGVRACALTPSTYY